MTGKTHILSGALLVVCVVAAGAALAESGARGAMLDRMFETLDTDGDGTITRAEVDGIRAARFAAADADGDGVLTRAEMVAAAETEMAERAERRIDGRIDRLDADGDGALTLEELAAGDRRMTRMFDRADADGDGAITKAEAEAMGPRMGGNRPASK